ncbi:MAG: hypothetical protein JWL95_868, partial [Gemmatimonadetes bacterium]|nr:hypothetical protein [Gemmatimonadota bacterium]
PDEQARLRFFIAATHTEEELETTVHLLAAALRRLDEPDDATVDRSSNEQRARTTVPA